MEIGATAMTPYRLQYEIHKCAIDHGFWHSNNLGEKLALIHSEVSEALEALRLEDHDAYIEELADVVIRVLDLAEYNGANLWTVVEEKHRRNIHRPYLHGKKF